MYALKVNVTRICCKSLYYRLTGTVRQLDELFI